MTCETCYCGRCRPTSAPAQCSACGEEIRFGVRDGATGWWHREAVDHAPIHGHRLTYADQARIEEEMTRERTRVSEKTGEVQTYTARTYSLKGDALRAYQATQEPEVVPEPEVARHDVTVDDFPPRSGIRQIANLIAKTDGWEIRRFTACRGPYMGGDGKVLSISDSVVLGARQVDTGRVVVASWRDGSFDSGYTGVLEDGHLTTTTANSTALKAWIKEIA